MAEQGTNVLLPAGGVGGLALGAWALRQGGMSTERIARRSVAFFVLTSTPNFICAAVLGCAARRRARCPAEGRGGGLRRFGALALATIVLVAVLPRILRRVGPDHDRRAARGAARRSAARHASRAGPAASARRRRRGRGLPAAGSGQPYAIARRDRLHGASTSPPLAAVVRRLRQHAPPIAAFVFAYVIGQLGGLVPCRAGSAASKAGWTAPWRSTAARWPRRPPRCSPTGSSSWGCRRSSARPPSSSCAGP